MKNQYSLWSQYLNKLYTYSFVTVGICAMQNNLLAHTKNAQDISQKNVASAGILSDQQHTQSIFFEPMLAGNNISQHIKHINETEDAEEEARHSARQAEKAAEDAREAAEDARYDNSDYYDDRPIFGFSIGGHRRHRYHGGYRGRHHRGGHRGGGRRHR
jgi:hypothetical protein